MIFSATADSAQSASLSSSSHARSLFLSERASLQKWFLGLLGVTGGVYAAARLGDFGSLVGAPPKDNKVCVAAFEARAGTL